MRIKDRQMWSGGNPLKQGHIYKCSICYYFAFTESLATFSHINRRNNKQEYLV